MNISFQLPAEMKTPCQLELKWNLFAEMNLRDQKMNLWSREPANSPYKYHTNTGQSSRPSR
jgi:hypothetical protein